MALQPYVGTLGTEQRFGFDSSWIEDIILQLSDAFNVRVLWNRDTALVAGACALAGGLVGGVAGGRLGAALGAGLGTAAGLGASAMYSLREIWATVRNRLEELTFIVLNFLRRLDAVDYMHAAQILMACGRSRRELVFAMLEFIATKLSCEVVSSLTAG